LMVDVALLLGPRLPAHAADHPDQLWPLCHREAV
jgi:hypothetical protein